MGDIRPLKGQHLGRPAAILGGGPSLPVDLRKVPQGALLISVNRHGQLLTDCDFIVATDKPEAEACKRLFPNTPLISPHTEHADYFYVVDSDVIDSGFSSPVAMWIARFMGCMPVILCGMDLYQTGTYWHDPRAKSSGTYQALENQLAAWKRARDQTRGAEHVYAAGGPLVGIFSAYSSAGCGDTANG